MPDLYPPSSPVARRLLDDAKAQARVRDEALRAESLQRALLRPDVFITAGPPCELVDGRAVLRVASVQVTCEPGEALRLAAAIWKTLVPDAQADADIRGAGAA